MHLQINGLDVYRATTEVSPLSSPPFFFPADLTTYAVQSVAFGHFPSDVIKAAGGDKAVIAGCELWY